MKNNKGFTLIELIAVIVVIIILAAIALPRIGDMQAKAREAQVDATKATVASALERAVTEGALASDADGTTAQAALGTASPLTKVPYLSSTAGFTVGDGWFTQGAAAVSVDAAKINN